MMKQVLLVCAFVMTALASLGAADFALYDQGTEPVIDYAQYGTFSGLGTENYKYQITNSPGLKKASGEGIFPNSTSVFKDPEYKKMKAEGKLEGSQWEYANMDDPKASFFKWTSCNEDPGVKQYYAALALERMGLLKEAVKAYYAAAVFFPRAVGYTYWETPWYIGPVALDKIRYITREHPELGLALVGASIKVKNGFDDDRKNDSFIVNPGKLVKAKPGQYDEKPVDLSKLQVIKTVGKGAVKLVEYENHHWQLFVNDKPYIIRGIGYSPNKIGLSPDYGTLNVSRDWMFADFNKNGIIDGPYEAWVDKNKNNRRDRDEKVVGDFQLMKEMGVNTMRIYDHADLNKQLLKDGYEKYGFMYVMGDLIGNYCVGSKAEWYAGTDYTNPEHQKNMLDRVRQMVEEYKDEPYILMWVLGNENNYSEPGQEGISSGNGCRAKLQPDAYYAFVNQAAKLIKELDPQQRPVAVCNGDILFLDKCAANAPELDVIGVNAYRGEQGFGSLWQDVADLMDKPAMITEYGCSAYHPLWDQKRAEAEQARYLVGNWKNIEENYDGRGMGTALGGFLFEWTDEWWKANSDLPLRVQQKSAKWYAARAETYKHLKPDTHDSVPQFGAPFLDGWSYEEWLGIASQGDGKSSPFLRQLRPAYYEYKKLWSKYK